MEFVHRTYLTRECGFADTTFTRKNENLMLNGGHALLNFLHSRVTLLDKGAGST